MSAGQASAYASTYEIVEESTPPVWLSLRGLESEVLFAAYIQNAWAPQLLSDFLPEWDLIVEGPDEPEFFVSAEESALFKNILLSSVKIIRD